MNKTRLAVIVGLMGTYYITMRILVPFDLPYFVSPSCCILALFFPYITKRYRSLIILIYQTYNVFIFGFTLSSFKELLTGLITSASEPVSTTAFSAESVLLLAILRALHIPLYGALLLGIYALSYGAIVIIILQYVVMFTQPYSIYFIYNKIGLVDRMKKTFPNASPEWFRS